MTSVIGFCIKRWREITCAFKYDSDSICLSLFSRTYERAGDERARSFPAPARVDARHQSAVRVMTWMCGGVFCCVCVRYLSLALSLYSGLSDPLSSVWLVEKQRGCGSI